MDLTLTLLVLAVLALLFALIWLRERRPKPLGTVRHFPYVFAMILCLVAMLATAAHLLALLGLSPSGPGAR